MFLDDKIQDFIKDASIFKERVNTMKFHIFSYLQDIGAWSNKQYIVVKEIYDDKFRFYVVVNNISFDLILQNESDYDEILVKIKFEKDRISFPVKVKEALIPLKDLTKNFFVFNTELEARLFLESKNL